MKNLLALLLACCAFASLASAKDAPVNATFFGNLAIQGYDPVAYFTDSKPVKGSADHAFTWNGAEWRFASADHLAKFKAAPEKYAPQYGGYCAWAVSQGKTANIDPASWKIVNDKLYLNYDSDIQKKWALDIPGNIKKADANWPKVLE